MFLCTCIISSVWYRTSVCLCWHDYMRVFSYRWLAYFSKNLFTFRWIVKKSCQATVWHSICSEFGENTKLKRNKWFIWSDIYCIHFREYQTGWCKFGLIPKMLFCIHLGIRIIRIWNLHIWMHLQSRVIAVFLTWFLKKKIAITSKCDFEKACI